MVTTRSLQPRTNLCFCKQTRHGREILAPGFMAIVAHLKPYNKKLTHGRCKVGHPCSTSIIERETLHRKGRQPLAPLPLVAGHVVTHATPKLLIVFFYCLRSVSICYEVCDKQKQDLVPFECVLDFLHLPSVCLPLVLFYYFGKSVALYHSVIGYILYNYWRTRGCDLGLSHLVRLT